MRPRTFLILLPLMLIALSCTPGEKAKPQPIASLETTPPSPVSDTNTGSQSQGGMFADLVDDIPPPPEGFVLEDEVNDKLTEPQRIAWSNLSPQMRELLSEIDDPEVLAVLLQVLRPSEEKRRQQVWRDQVPPLALFASGNVGDLEIAFLELEDYLRKQDSKIQDLESRVSMLEIALKSQSD